MRAGVDLGRLSRIRRPARPRNYSAAASAAALCVRAVGVPRDTRRAYCVIHGGRIMKKYRPNPDVVSPTDGRKVGRTDGQTD